MVHCGGEKGFVANALLMFKSGSKSDDYHDDMNHKNYMKWVEEKLLPNLEENSVLVIDNASYHNIDGAPTSVTKQADMPKWLNERGIFFETKETKPELYENIKLHKPIHKNYVLDRVMAQHGHSVLRLCELNPTEKIWAQVKNYVGTYNVTFKFPDMWNIAKQKFATIGEEEWRAIYTIYRMYVQWCQANSRLGAKKSTYRNSFNDNFNLGFYRPKNNQCRVCKAFNHEANPTEEMKTDYDAQQKLKENS
jgi:transposase